MAALDDLKTAVANLSASTSAEIDAIKKKLAGLGDSVSAADVETVVAQLGQVQANLDAETKTITGA